MNSETTDHVESGKGVLTKVLLFCIGLILVFTLVANLLPQVEGEAPVDKEIDLSSLTPESFAALGETLFNGKGTCTLCHKPAPLGRAPDIQNENMVGLAEEIMASEHYKGKAQNAAEYIHESMVDPSAYVVKNYGVAGSNDTVSPMPAVDVAPIELTAVEMDAITAYLQHKDGNEITVALPEEAPVAEVAPAGAPGATPAAATAEEAIKKYGCQACHSMLGTTSPVGPSLEDIGSLLDAAQLRESILDPAATITSGFADIMPKDFAEKMTVKELGMIIDLLLASTGKTTASSNTAPEPETGEAVTEAETETSAGTQDIVSEPAEEDVK